VIEATVAIAVELNVLNVEVLALDPPPLPLAGGVPVVKVIGSFRVRVMPW
jgi:hypothetical protein